MSRLANAVLAVRDAVAQSCDLAIDQVPPDDDLIDDLQLTQIERWQVGLYLEGKFDVEVPDELWNSPLYRTPASLAEWLIRKSEEAEWAEVQRQRKRRA